MNSHSVMVQGMSDEALAGAIGQLRAQSLTSWGSLRLRFLEGEKMRRDAEAAQAKREEEADPTELQRRRRHRRNAAA